MRIAVITTGIAGDQSGGAERFFSALVKAFGDIGHDAEEIRLRADEPDFEQIKRNYLACYDLDVSSYDMVVSTKAPTWMVRHPNHVCYLVHTIRVFYDMFDWSFPAPNEEQRAQRDLIHRLDTGGMSPPRCKAVFSIGEEVSRRLRESNGLDAEVLHPPLWNNHFREGRSGDYLFLPGRLHPWKRVDLAIRAMRHVSADVRLKIAGVGEADEELRALAARDERIEFLGRVTDAALLDLYANALAVPFTPMREDYGYVTLEAFASGKPVITCSDSGEAAAIVRNGENGFVCEADAQAIGRAIDALAADRELAVRMGLCGKAWVNGLSWERVARRLIEAAIDG
ncbi:glycosyltransferase family 4 protein [Luteimonas gilva]|uniref:Glycosyltransferase family 4 protein n=1 Tax=Luteimonas gilva TaxID=2572684 RepID=A0A4U5JN32_9GAMM|nr:glycosyltransferase family 4 protein [Luteimonas gilva]TKR29718.1 glycosyltransferase family 4 protein [Luteimonas gilva]